MTHDFLIIGAGISGAAAGYELSKHGSVVIVEAEASGSVHSTGRTAALYTPNYGNALVRKINRLSHSFLNAPPQGFASQPLLTPRGMMTVASATHLQELKNSFDNADDDIELIDAEQVMAKAPFLNAEKVAGAAFEEGVADMDVDALHQGFLTGVRARGGVIKTNAGVTALHFSYGVWEVQAGDDSYRAHYVINASGAWADKVGQLAGASEIGLQPKRRTAMLIEAPKNTVLKNVPAMDFLGVSHYIKPDAGKLMVSPGDAKTVPPHDVQADDLDIAYLVDWLEKQTSINVERVDYSWAGLRCFVTDDAPVVGFDPKLSNFFWLAAQGGYGVMMSSALGRACATLITKRTLPEDFLARGVNELDLGPQRLVS